MTSDESTPAPSLLEWMGRAFGDAVERATRKMPYIGGTPFDTLIQSLPAAIYTTDAAGRITYFNEAAAEPPGRLPDIGTSEFCSWNLYWLDQAWRMSNGCSFGRTAAYPRHGSDS